MAACKHRFHSRESMNGRMQLACFSTVKTCMVSKHSYAHTEDNDYWSLRSFKGCAPYIGRKAQNTCMPKNRGPREYLIIRVTTPLLFRESWCELLDYSIIVKKNKKFEKTAEALFS